MGCASSSGGKGSRPHQIALFLLILPQIVIFVYILQLVDSETIQAYTRDIREFAQVMSQEITLTPEVEVDNTLQISPFYLNILSKEFIWAYFGEAQDVV